MPDLTERLKNYFSAGFPCLYLVTYEEMRTEIALTAAAKVTGQAVYKWTVTRGWFSANPDRPAQESSINATKDPNKALQWTTEGPAESIYILRDFHPYLTNAEIVRRIRDILPLFAASGRVLVFESPYVVVPPEIEKEFTVVQCELPTAEELDTPLVACTSERPIDMPNRTAVLEAARGLTLAEAQNAFSLAIATHGNLGPDAVQTIMREAAQTVRKTGLLEFVEPLDDLSAVGGLNELKRYLTTRSRAFSKEAREYGLPVPKGLLLLGMPGCGKSLTAKAIAKTWQRRLLRLDMGRLFGGIVGESERNTRQVIAVAEAVAPCVLWVDELEQGFAGAASSGRTDSGTTARVIGTFLTWLSEKRTPVYVVATANDVTGLPPQILRKGRWDETFFVDLPTQMERAEILAIHLRKVGRDPEKFDVARLAMHADQFSGAEIEEAMVAGMWLAFDEKTEVTTAHIQRAIASTKTLASTAKEQLNELRAWSKDRARPATTVLSEEVPSARRIAVREDRKRG